MVELRNQNTKQEEEEREKNLKRKQKIIENAKINFCIFNTNNINRVAKLQESITKHPGRSNAVYATLRLPEILDNLSKD